MSYTKRDLPPRTCPACRCPIDECEGIREDCTAEATEVYETALALANIGTGVLIAHLAERATLYAQCATEFALDVMDLAPPSQADEYQLAKRWLEKYGPREAQP